MKASVSDGPGKGKSGPNRGKEGKFVDLSQLAAIVLPHQEQGDAKRCGWVPISGASKPTAPRPISGRHAMPSTPAGLASVLLPSEPSTDLGDDTDDEDISQIASSWGRQWTPMSDPGSAGPMEGKQYCCDDPVRIAKTARRRGWLRVRSDDAPPATEVGGARPSSAPARRRSKASALSVLAFALPEGLSQLVQGRPPAARVAPAEVSSPGARRGRSPVWGAGGRGRPPSPVIRAGFRSSMGPVVEGSVPPALPPCPEHEASTSRTAADRPLREWVAEAPREGGPAAAAAEAPAADRSSQMQISEYRGTCVLRFLETGDKLVVRRFCRGWSSGAPRRCAPASQAGG